jgi:hypothetical protein
MNTSLQHFIQIFKHLILLLIILFSYLICDLYFNVFTDYLWDFIFYFLNNKNEIVKNTVVLFLSNYNICQYSSVFADIPLKDCEIFINKNSFFLNNPLKKMLSNILSFIFYLHSNFLEFLYLLKDLCICYIFFLFAFFLVLSIFLIYFLIQYKNLLNAPILVLRHCQVCLYQEPNILLRPCNHLNICQNCFDFQRRITNRCPTCRTSINKFTNVYFY